MKQLLILSGKGGTGKTTTAAAFADFSQARALADCDVDAPNLHLVLNASGQPEQKDFLGGDKASIDPEKCLRCGACQSDCRFGAIQFKDGVFQVREHACEGCGVCAAVCPAGAITLEPDRAGKQLLYDDGQKVFSTAELKMGRGNSGKLVSEVKTDLRRRAAKDCPLAIVDGSPGIGCPVIASISGADLILIVAEPSRSGLSDLQRLVRSAHPLGAKIAVCVNKWDTGPQFTQEIARFCQAEALPFLGKIPYDPAASAAINRGLPLSRLDCPARDALREVYNGVLALLDL